MIVYGGTCPLCCGDVQIELASRSGGTTCSFCGLALDIHAAATSSHPMSAVMPGLEGAFQPSLGPQYALAAAPPIRPVTIGGPHVV